MDKRKAEYCHLRNEDDRVGSGDSKGNTKSKITFKKLACEVEGGDRPGTIGEDKNILSRLD